MTPHHRRKEDLRAGIAGWWLQPARRGWIAVLFVLLIISMIGLRSVHGRITGDERRTCMIQARGLPAGHELAASLRDIRALLLLPYPAKAPPRSPTAIRIIADLNEHLARYLLLEGRQPQERRC